MISPAVIRGRIAASWTQWGATIGPCPRRYADGVSPTIWRKVRLKVPRLVNPTSKQMSVTLRSVSLFTGPKVFRDTDIGLIVRVQRQTDTYDYISVTIRR